MLVEFLTVFGIAAVGGAAFTRAEPALRKKAKYCPDGFHVDEYKMLPGKGLPEDMLAEHAVCKRCGSKRLVKD
jgi:hypothetical protein